MDEFTAPDSDKFIFLLSTRAGGKLILYSELHFFLIIIFLKDWVSIYKLQIL
jgi:hypothetical protein